MRRRSRAFEAAAGCLCCDKTAGPRGVLAKPLSCDPVNGLCAHSINGRLYLACWSSAECVSVCAISIAQRQNRVQQRVSVARQPHLKTLTNQNKVFMQEQQQVLSCRSVCGSHSVFITEKSTDPVKIKKQIKRRVTFIAMVTEINTWFKFG